MLLLGRFRSAALLTLAFSTYRAAVPGCPDAGTIRGTIGMPLLGQVRMCLAGLRGTDAAPNDAAFDRLVAEYAERYRACQADVWRERIRVFAGVPEMLATLERAGCELAVVTSRTAPSCFTYLRHFDLAKYFPVVCTPDNTDKHKPNPEPAVFALNALLDAEARTGSSEAQALGHVARYCRRDAIPRDVLDNAWLIGDALTDVQCGNACGTKSVLARWGPETSAAGTAAAEQAATFVARTPEDVVRLVLREGANK